MAHSPPPPALPPKPRPRAQTLASNNRSPPTARSYQQPAGTASQQREWDRGMGGSGLGRQSSYTQVSASGPRGVAAGKRRAVFCDVVVDELELDEHGSCVYPPVAGRFVDQLGQAAGLPRAGPSRAPTPRPATPGKPPRVDIAAVRHNLKELWVTEESYLRKLASLHRDYAKPLRSFAKHDRTALIPAFAATHLFSNIDQLVPISVAFEKDLRVMVGQLDRNREQLPPQFGEMILHHVEQMEPFRKWLANHANADAIRRDLEKTNSSFNQFIEATQVRSRDSTQQTGGFKEFLAEPFQRVSRYRLMLDPMIKHLPPGDGNIEPLEIAVLILSDICSMQVDEATRKAAELWSLMEAIDGFPPAMVGYERQFVDCLDVDEIVESPDSRPQSLRCTLFLFTDKILIAKRPSGDKTGRQHVGLHDPDQLVQLYHTSNLTSSQASLMGSPKKLKKGIMGFRGLADLMELSAIDLGTLEFGVVLDRPPMDQSERWCGRSTRKFVVAQTYASDVRRAEKEVFLTRLAESQVGVRLKMGAKCAKRSARIWENGGVESSTEVYWVVWARREWENLPKTAKGKLALHLDEHGAVADELDSGAEGNPIVIARAVFLGRDQCRFSVRTQGSSSRAAETITLDRIAPAIAELGTSNGLYTLPVSRPTTPGGSRPRPRSAIISAALDVFGGSSSMKRGHSINSKASSATTTSRYTDSTSRPGTPVSPFDSSVSSRDDHARKLVTKSAPDLYGRAASASVSTVGSTIDDSDMFDQSMEILHSRSQTLAVPLPASNRNRERTHRRSSSLPGPPQPHFASPSPESESEPEPEPVYEPEQSPALDLTSEQFSMREDETISTSPIAYRPPAPARRRMMGPRDPGTAPGSAISPCHSNGPSPSYNPGPSEYRPAGHSPSRVVVPPFARDHSPTPIRRPQSDTYNSHDSLSTAVAKRPLVEASPRASPAKKVASIGEGFPRGPPASQMRPRVSSGGAQRVSSGGTQRIPSGSQARSRSRRIVSGASTIRGSSPPLSRAPSIPEPQPMDVFNDVDPESPRERECSLEETSDLPPLERLRQHIQSLRSKLGREVSNKENERIAPPPPGLSRSPHTRNVFLKATASSSSFASSFSEGRKAGSSVDLPALVRWTEDLTDLVAACEAASLLASGPVSPAPTHGSGPTEAEFATLDAERDLLAADLAALKEELTTLVDQDVALRQDLINATAENAKLRHAYEEIIGEVEVLYDEFNTRLGQVVTAMQVDVGNSAPTYVDLSDQLRTAVLEKTQAERELRQYHRDVQSELAEKAEWGRLLRQHGLLP